MDKVTGYAMWVSRSKIVIASIKAGDVHTYEVRDALDGVTLRNTDEGKDYWVNIAERTCTCPSFAWRQTECKHVKAMMCAIPKRPAC